MNITDFLIGYKTGKAQGGSGENPVSIYNRNLAEAVLSRRADSLGSSTVLNFAGFTYADGNKMGNLQQYVFAGFKNITGLIIDGIVMLDRYTFRDCVSLKTIDITVTDVIDSVTFYPRALDGCAALEAVIVRPGAIGLSRVNILTTANGYAETGQGANDSFYVYVPEAYYNTVVSNILSTSAITASRYRKLEDYPEIDNWNA